MRLHNTFFRALCNFFRAIRSPPPPPPPPSLKVPVRLWGETWALGTSTLISRLISTEEAHFYGGGSFLQRRLISTEEAYFYGGGLFLRRRLISTEEARFYGGGLFLRRRLISTEEAYFYSRLVCREEVCFHATTSSFCGNQDPSYRTGKLKF